MENRFSTTSTTTKPHVLTDADHAQLLENGRRQAEARAQSQEIDFVPVVKLHTPLAPARWLLTEIEPDHPDVAFGLCDLGFGQAEIGSVYLPDIAQADAGFEWRGMTSSRPRRIPQQGPERTDA